ncbi:hypothetical protein HDU79_011538 [Rhizoclosmatium sp. JEL0117]|nr:hypothetical protein HDU79_011538 [Rhizoclosmatium sp. JEL0117]
MSYIGLGLNLTVPRRGVFTGPNGQRFNPAAREADEVALDFYDANNDHNESLPPPISTTPVTFAATAFGISQGLYVLASMIPQLSKYTLARTRLNSMFQEMEPAVGVLESLRYS